MSTDRSVYFDRTRLSCAIFKAYSYLGSSALLKHGYLR
jgi:hypothetical protein